MKRSEIKVGDVYAYRQRSYLDPSKVTVVDSREWGTKVSSYRPLTEHALESGGTFQTASKPGKGQGVVVRFESGAYGIVPTRTLISTWAEHEAQEEADRKAREENARREAERERRDVEAGRYLDALPDDVKALLPTTTPWVRDYPDGTAYVRLASSWSASDVARLIKGLRGEA